jgi:hypothetical protein
VFCESTSGLSTTSRIKIEYLSAAKIVHSLVGNDRANLTAAIPLAKRIFFNAAETIGCRFPAHNALPGTAYTQVPVAALTIDSVLK